MKTVTMRSDEDPDDSRYMKGRSDDRPNSVTPKEGPLDRRYDNIVLQCLPPEYDRVRQTLFEREGCNLAEIRQIISKIYTDNLARSNSDSSEVPRDVASPCRRRGRTSATQNVTAAKSSATIRVTAPTLRQSASRISDADNASTSSEAGINHISRSRGG